MSQSVQVITQIPSAKGNSIKAVVNDEASTANSNSTELHSVMNDLSQLSKSFVNSYQSLEGQVEELNDQLINASEQRSEALLQKQTLVDEKDALADRLQNLLAILPSGVVVLDHQGKIKECNEVAIEILGRPLFGVSWLEVINRAFVPQADDGHQISLKDGRKIHIETKALDSEPGQIIVLTDMTKTRKLQAQLSQQQKLSSMGNMIASLAHQIRTPLSAAILYGSHINGNKIDSEKKQEFSGFLLERLRFMDRQINDMLNFVKGERKEKNFILVNSFVKDIKSTYQNLVNNIIFESDCLDSKDKNLLIDKDSLIGAIGNLINNAIDASSEKSSVNVIIKINRKNQFLIQVKDQGKGIHPSQLKKIFEPFYSSKNHGNGLGLSIVNGIVIEHQGQLAVDSELGKGSAFTIQLPTYPCQLHRDNKQLDTKEVIYVD